MRVLIYCVHYSILLSGMGLPVFRLCYARCTNITSLSKPKSQWTTPTRKRVPHVKPHNAWYACCASGCAVLGEARRWFRPPTLSGENRLNDVVSLVQFVFGSVPYNAGSFVRLSITLLPHVDIVNAGRLLMLRRLFPRREESVGVGVEARVSNEAWAIAMNRLLVTSKENDVSTITQEVASVRLPYVQKC